MNITVTGASGFIGRRLLEKLLANGHQLHILGRRRSPDLPAAVAFSVWDSMKEEPPPESLAAADAVIHLAGEPVAQRWTAEVKQRIRASRVEGTRHLVNALSTQSRRPAVLLCASAIGFYGSRGDEILTESSPPGDDFLAEVVLGWEGAAILAQSLGIRVVRLRFGVVLGKDGGALTKMLPPFRMGVGGRIASGKQWMSWVHLEDIVNLLSFAVENPSVRGPLNATAPNPVTNAEFTRELAAVLHRPAVLPIPGFAVKTLFGEMASVVLASQRVVPKAPLAAGFVFQFPQLRAALENIL